MEKEKIITSQNVHLYYGQKEALKGIDLDFPKSGIHALIGPSGCGKSTYLRCLNRMNDLIDNVKITGAIKLDGQDIYSPKTDTVELRKKLVWSFNSLIHFRFRSMKMLSMVYGSLESKINNCWMSGSKQV